MSLDFVAIDFETANPKRASVIQIGLAKVRDGVIIKKACSMVFPPSGFTNFAERNIAVHGLTPKTIHGAPYWPEILERLVRFTGDLPLVAHNAPFERSVINQASEAEGLLVPDFQYCCTQKLAQRLLPDAPSYKLDLLTEHLGKPSFSHHDAGDDAVACAELALAIAEHAGITDFEDLWPTEDLAKRTLNKYRRAAA